jgi:hypothetical protein
LCQRAKGLTKPRELLVHPSTSELPSLGLTTAFVEDLEFTAFLFADLLRQLPKLLLAVASLDFADSLCLGSKDLIAGRVS